MNFREEIDNESVSRENWFMAKPNLSEKIIKYLKTNPNIRHETLAAGIGETTKVTGPVLRGLVASKQVKQKGEKRATTYAVAA